MGIWCFVSKWKPVVIVLMIVPCLLWQGLLALAQDAEPVRLSALEIALWPEYDEPEVLIIFQGRLAGDVPLPAELTLAIPKEAGEPHAVASVDGEGRRLTAAYDVHVVGDKIEVTYTSLQDRAFQFEYYLDVLQIEGNQRRFTFRYQLDAAVDDLVLEFQQPSGATNVVLRPPAEETHSGFAGLTYHRLPLGALDAGQTVEWQASYDKPDLRLSAEALPAGEAEPSSSSESVFAVVALAGVALAVTLGGLGLAGSRRRAQDRRGKPPSREVKPSRRKKRRDRKGARPRSRTASAARSRSPSSRPARSEKPATPRAASFPEGGFCHQCGTQLKADALFCHRCGARRKEA